jgi:hypothetical protein
VFHISDKLNREVGIFLVLVVCTFSIKKSLRNISCHYLLATTKSNNYSYSLGCFQSMNPCQTPVIRPMKGKVNPQIAKSLLLSRCELASWGQINPCERASRPAEKQSKSLSARSPAPTPSDPGIFSTSGGVAPRALPRPRGLPAPGPQVSRRPTTSSICSSSTQSISSGCIPDSEVTTSSICSSSTQSISSGCIPDSEVTQARENLLPSSFATL